jgi:hypothetical protein
VTLKIICGWKSCYAITHFLLDTDKRFEIAVRDQSRIEELP